MAYQTGRPAGRISRRGLLLGIVPTLVRGQQRPTFSTDVKVIKVVTSVREKRGQIVSNLTKDDFVLLEDRRPPEIRYFARETGLSLTLGLLVDTSLSQVRVLGQDRTASYAVELPADVASSRRRRLGELEAPQRQPRRRRAAEPRFRTRSCWPPTSS